MLIQMAADATVAIPETPVAKSLKSRHKGGVPPENPVDRPGAHGGYSWDSWAPRTSDEYENGPAPNSQLGPGLFREWRLKAVQGLSAYRHLGAMPMYEKSRLRVVSSRPNPISPEFAAWLREMRAMSSATYRPTLALFDAPDRGPTSRHSGYGALALRINKRWGA